MRNPTPHTKGVPPMRKGTWSVDEDQRLIAYIRRYGIWNWTQMSKAAGLSRTGKSCRLRWMNYLRPGLKRGKISNEEAETIKTLHGVLGNKWTLIAAKLPGRTDNEIKNYWHTHLSKHTKNNDLKINDGLQEVQARAVESEPKNHNLPENGDSSLSITRAMSDDFEGYMGIPVSPQLSAVDSSSISDPVYGTYRDYTIEEVDNLFESFGEFSNYWDQPPLSVEDMGITVGELWGNTYT
ncbi:hypothetical protein Tsubulata_025139 [Turnera subulata]|uniref:Uncharacterized protein n=1 Tax=Turnera subulata TaxID=218843 RepID=A0A9Q0FFR7_9ROSI|nr:hypothetical protein Tsubulata_025139 [Turnera subulata]